MSLQTRLFEIVVTNVASLAIAEIYHERIVRRLRAEVASLKKDMSTLLDRAVDVLVERGFIPQNREPVARSTVVDRLLRRRTQYPGGSFSIGEILAAAGRGDDLPEGLILGPAPQKEEAKNKPDS